MFFTVVSILVFGAVPGYLWGYYDGLHKGAKIEKEVMEIVKQHARN